MLHAADLDARIAESRNAKQTKQAVTDFNFRMDVPTSDQPVHLAVSSDGCILSVCIKKNGFLFAQLFDIRVFSDTVC